MRTQPTLAAILLLAPFASWAQPPMKITLADAEKLAIQNNPQFSSARYTAGAAHQVPNQYRSAYLPNFSGAITGVGADNGSRLAAGGLNNPVVYDRLGTGLIASQMVTDFGRTGNLVGSSQLHAEAQDQFTEATRANILFATGTAYFGLLKAISLQRVAEETVKARQLVVDEVTALAEAQQKTSFDVSLASVDLSSAKLLLVQSQTDVKVAQTELATILGLPRVTDFDPIEEALPGPLPDRFDDLLNAAIQNRPELKDLRLEQSAAERFVKAEHALFYPSVGMLATAGFAPAAESAIPSRYGAIGVNVSIPIFNGGLFRSRQTEAELKAKAAADNVTDEQNRVARDVRLAYLNATTAYDRMALTKELLANANTALDLAKTRFDVGLGTIVELSQAQLNLTSAEIADTSARYDYQSQRINVDFQTGVLH